MGLVRDRSIRGSLFPVSDSVSSVVGQTQDPKSANDRVATVIMAINLITLKSLQETNQLNVVFEKPLFIAGYKL